MNNHKGNYVFYNPSEYFRKISRWTEHFRKENPFFNRSSGFNLVTDVQIVHARYAKICQYRTLYMLMTCVCDQNKDVKYVLLAVHHHLNEVDWWADSWHIRHPFSFPQKKKYKDTGLTGQYSSNRNHKRIRR